MKLLDLLQESDMEKIQDIFRRAEAAAYEEASEHRTRVTGNSIMALAKQIIAKEISHPQEAEAAEAKIAEMLKRDM